MDKTKLVWRLDNRPTSSEVKDLLTAEIITKDEAREILFREESQEDRDSKSLKEEIKFLRELVEKLSQNKPETIVRYITQYYPSYQPYPWFQPYYGWSTIVSSHAHFSNSSNVATSNTLTGNTLSGQRGSASGYGSATNSTFSSIKTF